MSQRKAPSVRTRALLAVIVAVVAGLVPAGAARAARAARAAEDGPKLTVLTRNLYLGTGLDNIAFPPTLPEMVHAVSTDWTNVLKNDFPIRARAIADEI